MPVIKKKLLIPRRYYDQTKQGYPLLRGRVIHGDGLGRTIGYPTANLTHNYFRAHSIPFGVYAGRVDIAGREYRALAIIGVDEKLEIHVLNFRRKLYGQYLSMRLRKRLRGLRSFSSTVRLQRQIMVDIKLARKALNPAA